MTLGQLIRAHRLRWGKLPGVSGFMRLSITPAGYLCELHPLGLVPNDHRANKTEYVIWWQGDSDKGQELIADSPFLRSLRKINKPFSVMLDEAGGKR